MDQPDKRRILEKHRESLLDLTLRNSLLNFRPSGKKVVPIINELPNEIYRLLIREGQTLALDPIIDETAPTNQSSPATHQSSQGSLPKLPNKSEESALIIPPFRSFGKTKQALEDLPSPDQISPEHLDDRLQTSLKLNEYDRRLANVQSEYRQLLDSTGSNFLYLAIGFLKWFMPGTEDPRLAPLLLIPLEIQRKREKVILVGEDGEELEVQHFAYTVRHSGELVSANYTLRLKLRSTYPTVDLPEPDIDDEGFDLESYLSKIKTFCEAIQLPGSPKWTVERQMGVAFFASGKEVMYRDLDPTAWPEDSPLLGGDLVSTALGFGEKRNTDREPGNPFTDSAVFYRNPIPTVLEADSSQMRALQTALEGHSVVIQGPPGTGKSQTITNLVAALLDQGKRVLFMAEKPEALKVVGERLEQVGLGDLCVELHSQKASPLHFQEQLKTRLDSKTQRNSTQLPATLKTLEKHRHQLDSYGETLIAKDQNNARSIPLSVFWKRESAAAECEKIWKHAHVGESLSLSSVTRLASGVNLTHEDSEDALTALQKVSSAWEEGVTDLQKFWEPFHPHRILHDGDVRNIEEIFQTGANTLERLKGYLNQEADLFFDQTSELCQQIELARKLPDCPTPPENSHLDLNHFHKLLNHLSRNTVLQSALCWIPAVKQLAESRSSVGYNQLFPSSLAKTKSPAFEKDQLDYLQHITQGAIANENTFGSNFNQAQTHRDLIEDATLLGKKIVEKFLDLSKSLQLENLPQTPAQVERFCEILQRTIQLDRHPRSMVCHQLLQTHAASRAYEEASIANSKLEERAKNSGKEVDLRGLRQQGNPRELLTQLRALSVSFWKYPLWGPKAQARRLAKQLHRSSEDNFLSPEWLDSLEDGIELLAQQDRFSQDQYFSENLGPGFVGLETRWSDLEETLALVKDFTNFPPQNGPTLINLAKNSNWDVEGWTQALDSLTRRLASLRAHQVHEKKWFPFHPDDTFEIIIEHFSKTSADLEATCSELSKWAPFQSLTFKATQDQLSTALAYLEAYDSACAAAAELSEELKEKTVTLDWPTLDQSISSLSWACHIDTQEFSDQAFKNLISRAAQNRWADLIQNASQISKSFSEFQTNSDRLLSYANLDEGSFYHQTPQGLDIGEVHSAWKLPHEAFLRLPLWSDYQLAMKEIRRLGVGELESFCSKQKLPPASLLPFFRLRYWDQCANDLISKNEDLRQLTRYDLEETISSFQKLDHSLADHYRAQVAKRAFVELKDCPPGNDRGRVGSFTEMGLVRHQSGLKRGLRPIREFVTRASESLGKLFPCWLMSPSSVAKFLPQDGITFDVVVIDEASQVKPEDALGCLARGGQAVIVGDSKQMPPSNFFRTIQNTTDPGDEEDDGNIVGESILEVAEGKQAFKQESLLWHYRSLHHSLISFSNERYYDGKLIVVPSVEKNSSHLGVQWNHVPAATFQKGLNETEAKKITDDFVARISEEALRPAAKRTSLGLVVMNMAQASRVRELIDHERLNNAEFAIAYEDFHSDGFPEAFVRNLERVQGDERDVIFIGFTYGPNPESGKVVRRFGPINGGSGSRRLNVLLSRAKQSMHVYASMKRDELLGGTACSGGVSDLADFLGYAESGQYHEKGKTSGKDPDSDFEVSVADLISVMGYEVDYQVGVSGFHIDLGIRRPGDHHYLCGIECDGATYHSHPIARDRDRLRQDILEARGWTIYRIWSTDWFRNRDSEIKRLQKFLHTLSLKPAFP